MLSIAGIFITIICIFGGFMAEGGQLTPILEAGPFELVMILGAAIGALVVSNNMEVIKDVLRGFGQIVKGPKWKRNDYNDLLCLLFELIKLLKNKGAVGLEPHIEHPHESAIFSKYTKISHDHFVCPFLCDTMRIMTMNVSDPHQVEDIMDKQLEKHHHEEMRAADGLQTMADGLPALGIVAAVLGIIKTMGSINEPPEKLGHMIGGALTGTFLGVFLAYGVVGPLAGRLKQLHNEDYQFMLTIRDTLVAYLHGAAIQVAVEIGRGAVPTGIQPNFAELEASLEKLRSDAPAAAEKAA
jgi:chemotaxis protein MotA